MNETNCAIKCCRNLCVCLPLIILCFIIIFYFNNNKDITVTIEGILNCVKQFNTSEMVAARSDSPVNNVPVKLYRKSSKSSWGRGQLLGTAQTDGHGRFRFAAVPVRFYTCGMDGNIFDDEVDDFCAKKLKCKLAIQGYFYLATEHTCVFSEYKYFLPAAYNDYPSNEMCHFSAATPLNFCSPLNLMFDNVTTINPNVGLLQNAPHCAQQQAFIAKKMNGEGKDISLRPAEFREQITSMGGDEYKAPISYELKAAFVIL